jgi:hypothetical protein
MVPALITNLTPDPQRPEEEKLVTGKMPFQYPPMINHMARAIKEIHRHPTRTILLMDTTKTRPNLTISLTCRHQSTRHSKSHREELSYAIMMASEEGVVTLAGEASRHDVKPVGMTGPGRGNHLAMTTVRTTTATRISIALHAAAMTKGRAPAAMTMTQLHEEQREAAAVAEIHHRTPRLKGVTLHYPHQAAPMAAAVAVAAQLGHASQKDLQDKKPYDARTHLNEIAKSQTAFFLSPKCFGQRIHDEPIPHGFKIEKNIRQYNGVDMPLTWLQDYFNAVQFTGGSPNVAVCYLPLMLSGTARLWINDLAETSIQTWFDMQTAFTKNFEGTYKRPHNIGDLQWCRRADDETSRTFLARWLDMKNSCEGVTDESAILAFIDSLERG